MKEVKAIFKPFAVVFMQQIGLKVVFKRSFWKKPFKTLMSNNILSGKTQRQQTCTGRMGFYPLEYRVMRLLI